MEKVKLCELVDIYLGVTHTPGYVFEGVPFLSVKDISGGKICFDDCKYISQEEYESLSEGAKPKVGDMLFCRVGTLGKPIIIPEGTPLFGSFVSLGYLRNKNSDRCDLNYLRYWMYSNSFWKQVNSNVKGASQVNLNTGWLSKFDIDLPDMQEQIYRISVLDKCKAIIEQREEELKVLDDLIKARFVELFGDLKSNTKGWEIKTFDELTYLITDGEHATPRREDKGIYLLSARNVLNHSIQLEDVDYIDKEEYDRITKRVIPQAGDVLISCSGTVGRCCSVPVGLKFQMVRSVALLRFKENINPVFAEYMITSDYLQEQINSSKTASSQANLFQGKIKALKGFVPPIELQDEFLDFANQVDKSKSEVQKSIDEMQMLMDSLLQEYFG